MARYRLTPRARRNLTAIRHYIAADSSPERADAVIKRIRDRCRLLEVAPAQGQVRDDAPIADEVRSVFVMPYIVFYQIARNVVQILRVLDGRRDLGTAFFPDQVCF